MKRLILCVVAMSAGLADAEGALVLQPWTGTETSQFELTGPALAGSGWTGNTLTLVYDGTSASSGTNPDGNVVPTNAIGVHFGASVDSVAGSADIMAQGNIYHDGFVQHSVNSHYSPVHGVTNWQMNAWWGSGSTVTIDIPESTTGDVTTVDFIFPSGVTGEPYTRLYFSGQNVLGGAGTTTYTDVSWILDSTDPLPYSPPTNPNPQSDPTIVPEPASLAIWFLIALGFAGMHWRRRGVRP